MGAGRERSVSNIARVGWGSVTGGWSIDLTNYYQLPTKIFFRFQFTVIRDGCQILQGLSGNMAVLDRGNGQEIATFLPIFLPLCWYYIKVPGLNPRIIDLC